MAAPRPEPGRGVDLIDPLGTQERRVATAFSQLDPEWAVHVQPRLTMDVPDLLVVHPRHGVVAVEILDWTGDDHRPDGRGGVERRDEEGWSPCPDQSLFRAARNRMVVFEQFVALPDDESSDGVRAVVLLPEMSTARARALLPAPSDGVTVWGGDALGSPEAMLVGPEPTPLSPRALRRLTHHMAQSNAMFERSTRRRLSPSATEIAENPQRLLIRGVRGPSGSGTTFGLAARAAHLAGTGRTVLVLTMSQTTTSRVRSLVNTRCREIAANAARVVCMSMHGFCRRVAEDATAAGLKLHLPPGTPLHDMNVTRAHAAYARGFGPRFDAVLVDEAQHMPLDWWTLLRTYVRAPGGEMLFVADPTQARVEHWDAGALERMGVTPPWIEMSGSYRLPPDMVPILAAFVERHLPGTAAPSEPADRGQVIGDGAPTTWRWTDLPHGRGRADDAGLGAALAEEVVSLLAADPTLSADDVAVLCDSHDHGLDAVRRLEAHGLEVHHLFAIEPEEQRRRKQRFWPEGGGVSGATVDAFAGWESRAVVLGITPGQDAARRAYLGLTRLQSSGDGRASALAVVNAEPTLRGFGHDVATPPHATDWTVVEPQFALLGSPDPTAGVDGPPSAG